MWVTLLTCGALPALGVRLCMGCTARAWSRLAAGVHRWHAADVPPRETVTALRVAKRQCPALGVHSSSEDEKFPPNVLTHLACSYAHGN